MDPRKHEEYITCSNQQDINRSSNSMQSHTKPEYQTLTGELYIYIKHKKASYISDKTI